jgi:hypothetical protein
MGNDGILAAASQNQHLLIAEVRPPTRDLEPDSLLANWDIVLADG